MGSFRVYATAAGIGAVAGLRSMTAPALVSRAAASGDLRIREPRLRWMSANASAKTLTLLALGEMIADKAPFIPNRTDAGPLSARIVSGGLCGAVICSAGKQSAIAGGIVGGLAAVGGAFLGYQARKRLPGFGTGLAEDVVAIGSGLAVLTSAR